MRLLAVDTSKSFLSALRFSISKLMESEVEGFSDHSNGIARAGEREFELVVIGSTMPKENGMNAIKQLRAQPHHRDVPIIFISSLAERSTWIEARNAGASDFLPKPTRLSELQTWVLNLLALSRAAAALVERERQISVLMAQARHIEMLRLASATEAAMRERETIWCLAQAMASRDGNTGNHVERVASVAEFIAGGLGMDAASCRNIGIAAPLHDIGKIGIPDAILKKPGKLTPDEMEQMRTHVPIGVGILRDSTTELARVTRAIIAGHHEKWDGSGYPLGLSNSAIPLEARVVAVADVFEALCSERPYKAAWPIERAYEEIISSSGSHFDPACVEAFKSSWPSIRALFESPQDDREIEPVGDMEIVLAFHPSAVNAPLDCWFHMAEDDRPVVWQAAE